MIHLHNPIATNLTRKSCVHIFLLTKQKCYYWYIIIIFLQTVAYFFLTLNMLLKLFISFIQSVLIHCTWQHLVHNHKACGSLFVHKHRRKRRLYTDTGINLMWNKMLQTSYTHKFHISFKLFTMQINVNMIIIPTVTVFFIIISSPQYNTPVSLDSTLSACFKRRSSTGVRRHQWKKHPKRQ